MRINRSNAAEPAQPEPHRPEPQPSAAPRTPPKTPVPPLPEPEYEEEDEEEAPRRGHGCLISLVIFVILMALVAFGGLQVFKGYQELSGGGKTGAEQEFVVEQGSSISAIAVDLK